MNKRRTDLRDLPSRRFRLDPVPVDFVNFADMLLIPRLNLRGYKIDLKQQVARHCLYSLIANALAGFTTADSRDTSRFRLRVQVWDRVLEAGMAHMSLGSEMSHKTSRYFPTVWLLEQRRLWEMGLLTDVDLPNPDDDLGLIVLSSGHRDWLTGQPIRHPHPVSIRNRIESTGQRDPRDIRKADCRAVENGIQYFRNVETLIDQINRSNLRHSWVAYRPVSGVDGEQRLIAFQPNVCLRQIHSRRLFRYCRLYSWGPVSAQNLSKDIRATIRIDDEPTVELDFVSYHVRMLLHLAGVDSRDDVYKVESLCPNVIAQHKPAIREIIKTAVNIGWNTTSRAAAIGAIRRQLEADPDEIRNVLHGTPAELLDRIQASLPELQHRFFTGIGAELMTIDGKIMLHILHRFQQHGKPALGIHDSIIVKRSDKSFAKRTMTEIYAQFLGFPPVIRVF